MNKIYPRFKYLPVCTYIYKYFLSLGDLDDGLPAGIRFRDGRLSVAKKYKNILERITRLSDVSRLCLIHYLIIQTKNNKCF